MDIDQLARTVKDLEYRIKQLEKAHNPVVLYGGLSASDMATLAKRGPGKIESQFCACGKDKLLCRAPDCPSHKPDPMGR